MCIVVLVSLHAATIAFLTDASTAPAAAGRQVALWKSIVVEVVFVYCMEFNSFAFNNLFSFRSRLFSYFGTVAFRSSIPRSSSFCGGKTLVRALSLKVSFSFFSTGSLQTKRMMKKQS
mmetsp:Transcript_41775/g.97813  ORF Transcript_41775/g.97813 Transcript_41775/m.97813 type:complete len:118 (-) Transcript_41775:314-667(-)